MKGTIVQEKSGIFKIHMNVELSSLVEFKLK